MPLQLRAGPHLKRPRIARHSRNLLLPQKLQQLPRRLDPDVVGLVRLVPLVQRRAFGVAHVGVLAQVAEADDQDVAAPDVGGSDVLGFEGL